MKLRVSALLVAAGLTLACGIARAADATVIQENKKFDKAVVTIHKGQTVSFVNNDPFTHNVYSETPGLAFDLRTQLPGKASDVKFDTVGEATIECAIHPSMKMTVKVVP